MATTVFLFDIDGTLVSGAGAGRRAMLTAYQRVIGDASSLDTVRFAGLTDRRIVRTAFKNAGLFEDEGLIDAVLEEYLDLLPAEIEAASEYGAHLGVAEALAAVEDRSDVAIGLGTGNVEAGARCKLAPLGLNERFSFGGFGNDAEERPLLLRIGAQRGAERLGASIKHCRLVVVGDTPRDIEAAVEIGAESLAVATGTFPIDELRAARPTLAVGSLTEPDALAFLRG